MEAVKQNGHKLVDVDVYQQIQESFQSIPSTKPVQQEEGFDYTFVIGIQIDHAKVCSLERDKDVKDIARKIANWMQDWSEFSYLLNF